MHAAFDNTEAWSPMYQRNNKRTGLKNVRCFPYCSDQHIEKGFCGRPVILRVARSYRENSPPVFSWGEFRRVDDPREVDINTLVSGDELRSRTKDPKGSKAETLNAPYFEGIVEGGEKSRAAPLVKFIFNQRKKGWNYAWQASKHTAKARHAFFAYLFAEEPDDVFRCVGVYISPTFILYCRKRKPELAALGRGGKGGVNVDDMDFLFDDDEEDDGSDGEEKSPAQLSNSLKRAKPFSAQQQQQTSASKKKKRSPNATSTESFSVAFAADERPRTKTVHLEPIVSPAKFPQAGAAAAGGGLPPANSFFGLTGGLTPITAMFLANLSADDPPASNGDRSSATNTPSSFSDNDSDEIDFEAANEVDTSVIARVGTVLNRLHAVLTADGSAATLGLPQFALDFFIEDLEEFADFGGIHQPLPTINGSSSSLSRPSSFTNVLPVTPKDVLSSSVFEPLEWSAARPVDMINELGNYILEESSLTASIRQIIARAEEGKLNEETRVKAFVRVFSNELSMFLAKKGYTEQELDAALASSQNSSGTNTPQETVHRTLQSLDNHVQKLMETQKRVASAKIETARSWRIASVPAEVDFSGHWRLDDTLINAFDECRAKRGVPYMMRKLLSYMENKIVVTQTVDRIVIGLKSKLFASTEVAYELDGQERTWDVAPPIPWPTKLCENYAAWIGREDNTLHYYHVYNGTSRTNRVVRKNASGDRLEMDILYSEKVGNEWKTLISRKGYALRISAIDY